VYRITKEKTLKILSTRELKSPIVTISKGKHDELLISYQNSNDLSHVSQDLHEIEGLTGEFDSPSVRQGRMNDGFNHSLDDYFILWVKGGKGLSVVSKK